MARKRIEERRLNDELVASIDDEIERITALLSTVIKVANVTKRELEKELGASGGYLSRLLSGKMGLSIRHILLICAAIGMQPEEFFHLAYPEAPGEGSGMAHDILRRFQGLGYEGKGAPRNLPLLKSTASSMPFMQQTPPMPPMPPTSSPGGGVSSGGTPALSDIELDERIRASLGRALRELVTGDLPSFQAAGSAQGASPLAPMAPIAPIAPVAPKRSTRGRK
jgi:transcriptional regulator with XRE-family HTH domain